MRIIFIIIPLMLLWAGCTNQKKDPVSLSLDFQPAKDTPKPKGSHAALGLAGYAKVMCSAIFVSGREPEEAFENSGFFFMPEADNSGVEYLVDMNARSVTMSLGDSLVRSASYYGDQGCIIQTSEGVQFKPVQVISTLPDPDTMDWPMGDLNEKVEVPLLHLDSVDKAVDLAFQNQAFTTAFLVVHQGKIIAERYAPGFDLNSQFESWSMGKSLTATLIGRLIYLGYFSLDDLAPIDAWKREGDPRSAIRIRDLLQMSSGLQFSSHRDPEVIMTTEYYSPNQYLDHLYIYTGAVDAFDYSIKRPLQFPIGTEGRYRNCDPLTLGLIIRLTTEKNGINYYTFPQRFLFDKIGIRRQVMETDPYGNFLLTGYDYGTARNWARMGLLYLNDGVTTTGERILPEGWSDFVSTPAPAWDEPIYGGQFWLNKTEAFPIPTDAYYMAGGGGQRTIIIPSLDMVIVRLGHFRGGSKSDPALRKALRTLMSGMKTAS